MIKNLQVKNFKSIKCLELNCKKVNIFIGKPNTGKSNILESIGIFSFPYKERGLRDFVRFENMANLFYDHDTNEEIQITADGRYSCIVRFENGIFKGTGSESVDREDIGALLSAFNFNFEFDYYGKGSSGQSSNRPPFKFYRFEVINNFPIQEANFLLPPRGENLLVILQTNKALKRVMSDILGEFGLRVVLKPQENKIEVLKDVEDVIISYPYSLVSDTLQRIVFHLAAIDTNKDSVIIFEEPEAHAFPYYTKFFAERISLDKTNQYFISTHNPYLLLALLEKTPKDSIGIFITYFEDYQTKVKLLTEKEMQEILDLDASVFFNIDQFLEEK